MTELQTADSLTSCSKRLLHNSVRLHSDERNAELLIRVTGSRLHLEQILVIYARRDLTVWLSNFLFPMLTGYRCLVSECYIHNIILLGDQRYMDHRYHALLPMQGSANFRIVGHFSLQNMPCGRDKRLINFLSSLRGFLTTLIITVAVMGLSSTSCQLATLILVWSRVLLIIGSLFY